MATKGAGAALFVYRRLPIPLTVRRFIRDGVFLLVERGLVQSSSYRRWKATYRGLQYLNAPAPPRVFAPMPLPPAPAEEAWEALPPLPLRTPPAVDVIIPAYRGYAETLHCIFSVVANPCATAFELIVINDASPDDRLSETLRAWAASGKFTLIEQPKNLGFVQTANRGMQLHPERDVVLLNADTKVFGNWLDRLRAAAYRDPAIATVTPLSNNAEICSYPYFTENHTGGLSVEDAALDRLAAHANRAHTVPLPTAVGFCMYVKRSVLQAIGGFNAAAFGKGYGEENDFCQRASMAGYRHVLAADVFVRHYGGVSFGHAKSRRVARGLRTLNRLHPQYAGAVRRFIAEDPGMTARRRLDLAQLCHLLQGRPVMLLVTHQWGGGTERHVQDMVAALARESVATIVLRPHPTEGHKLTLESNAATPLPNLLFDWSTEQSDLEEALASLNVRHLHVHHLIGFTQGIIDYLPVLAKRLKIAYDFTAHDYFSVCPRINLIGGDNVYCGEPEVTACEACVRVHGGHNGQLPVWLWRAHYRHFLEGARYVFATGRDAADRLIRYFPSASIVTRSHPESSPHVQGAFAPMPPAFTQTHPLRVAVIGSIGHHKGAHVLAACVKDAQQRRLPLHFCIVGTCSEWLPRKYASYFSVTGAYEESEVFDRLKLQACHMAFLPSVWPETHCYTLSIAFSANLFPVVFDLGAQAQRIRENRWGHTLPLSLATRASELNDALLHIRPTPRPHGLSGDVSYPSMLQDYYGMPAATWGAHAPPQPVKQAP